MGEPRRVASALGKPGRARWRRRREARGVDVGERLGGAERRGEIAGPRRSDRRNGWREDLELRPVEGAELGGLGAERDVVGGRAARDGATRAGVGRADAGGGPGTRFGRPGRRRRRLPRTGRRRRRWCRPRRSCARHRLRCRVSGRQRRERRRGGRRCRRQGRRRRRGGRSVGASGRREQQATDARRQDQGTGPRRHGPPGIALRSEPVKFRVVRRSAAARSRAQVLPDRMRLPKCGYGASAMRIAVITTSFPASLGDPSGHFVQTEARLLARHAEVVVITSRRAARSGSSRAR